MVGQLRAPRRLARVEDSEQSGNEDPSKVPAPPIEAIGAPRPWILLRFNTSAPISVPRLR